MLRSSVNSSWRRQILFPKAQIRSFSNCLLKNQQVSSVPSTDSPSDLTWSNFFKLRKLERTINTASSVTTALFTSSLSWQYISNVEIDPTQMIFGFDPFMIFFAGFLTTGALGYLLGPGLGNVLFRLKNSAQLELYKTKNNEFRGKIARLRVDPSSQSFSNPVPDYYGEKIKSLKDYRNWLRDCHTYRRKAQEFL